MSKNASTYDQLLQLGKDALDAVKRPFQVAKAKNNLKGEIITLEGDIAESELNIVEAKGKQPLDIMSILDAIDNKELKERELKQANALMDELFPN